MPYSYSHTFRKNVARGRPGVRTRRIRRERGVLFLLDPYLDDVAPPVDVRRDAFAAWVKRVLAQAKTSRGLSVPKIADMAGIGNNTIYRWRDGGGKELPNPEQVLAFCDALDIPPVAAFSILWPGKNEALPAPGPIALDGDFQSLMRILNDPNTSDFDREFIRETIRQLVDRPMRPGRAPQRTRRSGIAN